MQQLIILLRYEIRQGILIVRMARKTYFFSVYYDTKASVFLFMLNNINLSYSNALSDLKRKSKNS